jgi:hypothetical protein
MSPSSRAGEEALDLARRALEEIAITIDYDDRDGTSSGEKEVLRGLDAVASALTELAGLDLEAEPLDRVLAEMGAGEAMVETAAELVERLGRSSYTGLSKEDAEAAEDLRGELYDGLSNLVRGMGS